MLAATPVMLLIDDDPVALAELGEAVERRYGRDYLVCAETSALAGLRKLVELKAQDQEVALVIADQWMPEMTGVDFLTRAHELHPGAKRALLVGTMDQSAFAPILQATALGRIDLHLHKPWHPADDLLHLPIAELLAEWSRAHRARIEQVRIIGNQWDRRSHELRDLLSRNNIAYVFHDRDSPAGRGALRELGVIGDELPVVAVRGGPTFVRPSNVEIATAFGVKTRADPSVCDVAVIGAGPAGLAAAVYSASEGLHTVVVEREAIGGQAGTSSMVRNYLGFPRGVSGSELAQRAYSQAWHFGAQFIFAQEAARLRLDGAERVVALSGGSELRARAVVIATGVSYRRIDVPSIDRLLGAGVFYGSAASETKAMQGQHVFVVGGANSAGQAALHLSRYAERVSLLARRDSISATMSAYLVREIERAPNIEVLLNTSPLEGLGDERLEGLVLLNGATGKRTEVAAGALFILIGAAPRTEWLDGCVQRDGRGFILTGSDPSGGNGGDNSPHAYAPRLFETSAPGVFAVGDARHRSVKRVASAVGEGAVVISLVHEYLDQLGRNPSEP